MRDYEVLVGETGQTVGRTQKRRLGSVRFPTTKSCLIEPPSPDVALERCCARKSRARGSHAVTWRRAAVGCGCSHPASRGRHRDGLSKAMNEKIRRRSSRAATTLLGQVRGSGTRHPPRWYGDG